jgi:hypothetical protein
MKYYSVALGLALSLCPGLFAKGKEVRPIGDSEVFNLVPDPGFPEGIALRGDRVYVSGPATFGLNIAPEVWAYDRNSHEFVGSYPIQPLNPFVESRALSCIAFGPDGKLYAVEPFVGIIRLNLDPNNTQEVYSFFPAPSGPTLLNDLAFDQEGNLYVTDSFQGAIFRIRPGGGAPELWFQDPRLLGNPNLPFVWGEWRSYRQKDRPNVSHRNRQQRDERPSPAAAGCAKPCRD